MFLLHAYLHRDHLAADQLLDPVGVFGDDALVDLEELLRVGPRELHHLQVADGEARAEQLVEDLAQHPVCDRVRSHEKQRALVGLGEHRLGRVGAKVGLHLRLRPAQIRRAGDAGLALNHALPERTGRGALTDCTVQGSHTHDLPRPPATSPGSHMHPPGC